MKLVEILTEYTSLTLNRPFSYLYDGDEKIDAGYRVKVTFNNREIVGYVTKVEETNKTPIELEEETGLKYGFIGEIIDHTPLLNDDLLSLAEQISSYYLSPKIKVLQTMLPPSLSPKSSALKKPKIAYEDYLYVVNEDETGLTNKQIEILRLIKNEGRVLKKEVNSTSIVNKLLLLNRIAIQKEEKRRLKLPTYEEKEIPSLTVDQQKVVDEFIDSDDEVYLLQGVTGSGKSEVYLSLSDYVLKQGKTVLMLVPEISLTPMMNEYFIRRFKGEVAILHSELTPAEKYDEYRKISKGECRVVVGARSAIFAPLENIGLIILDEEHVESYKQDTPPFYHAREVAIIRGKMHHAKVLLGSATPSLESKARASKNVYHLLSLDKRINQQPLPKTTIVNLADYRNIDRDSYIFSLPLRKALSRVLENHEQAILLINRRGYSTTLTCRKCGYIFRCPNCGISLTYHRIDNLLKCHHCGHIELYPSSCPKCGSESLLKTGFGTERIEDEVKKLYPNARTLRLDSDSAKIRTKIPSIVESFRKKEADILIGTQMIAKGHDFPDVTLVGIVLADIGLSMPTYRSNERVFQLITQAVGRSGRNDKKGEAFIQTYNPTHYAITLAAQQNYNLFYTKEMGMRKVSNYPPYCYVASINVSGKNEEKVVNLAFNLADYIRQYHIDSVDVLGPITPYLATYDDNVLRTVIVKYRDYKKVQDVLKKILSHFGMNSSLNISINVDPYNF